MKMIKKHSCKNEPKRECHPKRLIWMIRAVICILLVVIVCSGCALLQIGRLKAGIFPDAQDSDADKIRIYIDQGHNPSQYHNNGAEGNGLLEQDLTFNIGCLLSDLLIEDGRFEVCLSRPNEDTVLGTDNLSSLKARVDGATAFDADYFISLHINSFTRDDVNGIEVFSPIDDEVSYAFGESLLCGLLDSTNLKNRGMKHSSALYVLVNTNMTAVLLEMGFISNPSDAAKLEEHPELFAKGIYDGILNYFESMYRLEISVLVCTIVVSTTFIVALVVTACVIKKKSKSYCI